MLLRQSGISLYPDFRFLIKKGKNDKKIIYGIAIVTLLLNISIVSAQKTAITKAANSEALSVVNKYLDIVLLENKKGEGLPGILSDVFTFDDPLSKGFQCQGIY